MSEAIHEYHFDGRSVRAVISVGDDKRELVKLSFGGGTNHVFIDYTVLEAVAADARKFFCGEPRQ